MRNRAISDNEFIILTRGIIKYMSPVHGELTHFSQTMKIRHVYKSDSIELTFATSYDTRFRISHLRTMVYNHKALRRPVNLVLSHEHKRELYKLLKCMADFKLN